MISTKAKATTVGKNKGRPEDDPKQKSRPLFIVDSRGGRHQYVNVALPTADHRTTTMTFRASEANMMQDATPSLRGANLVAPLYAAICEAGCNLAYSHLMDRHAKGWKTCRCEECRLEQAAIHAMQVQEECGVNLGWKAVELDNRRDFVSMGEAAGMHEVKKHRRKGHVE